MYYFIGRVATLTRKENNDCSCTFNVETSIKVDGDCIPIAYTCDQEKQFISVPGSFKVSEKLFDFISQHSREKHKIGFEMVTGEQGDSAESTASGTGEQGNSAESEASDASKQGNSAEDETIGTIKEVTLQNE